MVKLYNFVWISTYIFLVFNRPYLLLWITDIDVTNYSILFFILVKNYIEARGWLSWLGIRRGLRS